MSEDERKLFVAGLGEEITEVELREAIVSTGAEIAELSVPRDRATGVPRGFAFVTLRTAEQAEATLRALDGQVMGGKPVSVRPFRSERSASAGPRSERPPGGGAPRFTARPPQQEDSTLYVGNLPFDAGPEEITQLFATAGFAGVKRVHLPTDPEGRKRGFGFVTLVDAETALKASEELQGHMFQGRALSVNIARRGGGGGGAPPGGGGAPPPRGPRPSQPPDERRHAGPALSVRPPPEPGEQSEERRSGARREKKKDKKRKGRGLGPERSHSRRKNEGFNSPRHRGSFDDWDEE